MTKPLVFFAVGIVCLILRSLIDGHIPFFGEAPDLLLILVAYSGIFRNPIRGCLLVFALGLVADVAAHGGYLGLASLAYLAVFLLARLTGRLFYARNPLVQVIIGLVAVVLFAVMVHRSLYELGVPVSAWPGAWGPIAARAAVTGLAAPLVFRALFVVESWASVEAEVDPPWRRRAGSDGWIR